MSKSIGQNISTILKQAIAIPVELTAVTVEVAADASDLTAQAVRGAVPTVKDLGTISGHFVVGAFNSDKDEKEVQEALEGMTIGQMLENAKEGSVSAGQSTTLALVAFFDEEVQEAHSAKK